VSASTVSRVMTGSSTQIPISKETRERVMKAARELGYRPHPSARALSGKRTNLIGVIAREIGDPFFAELIEVISSAAKERGYDLVLGNAKRDPEQALALRDTMLDLRFCDGILLCGDLAESPEDHRFLSRLEADQRLVSVARGITQHVGQSASVGVDNRKGTLLAMDYLVGLGHRKIACFCVDRVGDLWERLEAYREFMLNHVGEIPLDYIQSAENSPSGGYRAARDLLMLASPPTAIFALDDTMAVGALSAAIDLGMSVPRSISIVGFDDAPMSSFVRPALTTIRQPIQSMGEQAVASLVGMIEGRVLSNSERRVCLEPVLVVRGSSGPPGV